MQPFRRGGGGPHNARAMAQQAIELILLRQWASYLTIPVMLVDREGLLLFYNEAAEKVLGQRFEDVDDLRAESLAELFQLRHEDGRKLTAEEHPLGVALHERRPSHLRMRLRALDGSWRLIESTAMPVEAQGTRHLGAFAMFWEVPGP